MPETLTLIDNCVVSRPLSTLQFPSFLASSHAKIPPKPLRPQLSNTTTPTTTDRRVKKTQTKPIEQGLSSLSQKDDPLLGPNLSPHHRRFKYLRSCASQNTQPDAIDGMRSHRSVLNVFHRQSACCERQFCNYFHWQKVTQRDVHTLFT